MPFNQSQAPANAASRRSRPGASRPRTLFCAGLILSGLGLTAQALAVGLLPQANQRIASNNVIELASVGLAALSVLYASWQVRHQRRLCLAWLVSLLVGRLWNPSFKGFGPSVMPAQKFTRGTGGAHR